MDWQYGHPRMFARVEDPFVVQAARPARFRRRMISNEWDRAPPFVPDQRDFLDVDFGFGMQRSRSHNGRTYAPNHPNAVPIVINNNLRQMQEEVAVRGRPASMVEPDLDYDQIPVPLPRREHERPATGHMGGTLGSPIGGHMAAHMAAPEPPSRDSSPFRKWQLEHENEQTKKELEQFKKEKERKEQEQRIKDQLILQRAREEQEARDEADRRKKIQEEAIKEWQNKEMLRIAEEDKKRREEAEKMKRLEEEAIKKWQREEKEKADKEKQEREQKEKEYKERLKRDLGLSDTQVAKLVNKENTAALDLKRTTYTKIARRHISLETLRVYDLPYKLDDHDPEGYVLVKRWVPEYLQERLWEHTRRIREEREFHQRKRLLEEEKLKVIQKKRIVRSRSPGLLDLFAPRR